MAGALILSSDSIWENIQEYTCQHLETLENSSYFEVWASLYTGRVLQSQAVFGLRGKVFIVEVGGQGGGVWSCNSGFCEKMPEASPVYERVNARWLQDGSAADQD